VTIEADIPADANGVLYSCPRGAQMDTSVEAVTTDTLGRRTGPRRLRTNEEKRRIVEEPLKPGASVAIVARAQPLILGEIERGASNHGAPGANGAARAE
jgi:hypothetical protein